MKKIFITSFIVSFMILSGSYLFAQCSIPGPAILSESCFIQGLNEPTDGTLDPSVRGQVYGMGSTDFILFFGPNSACNADLSDISDCVTNCTTQGAHWQIDLTGCTTLGGVTCGAGSAVLNDNWDKAAQGCEDGTDTDPSKSAVTVVLLEQLSPTAPQVPQYLIAAVGQAGPIDSIAYEFDRPGNLNPRSFLDLPVVTVTSVTADGMGNLNVVLNWNGSTYYNQGDGSNPSGGVNLKLTECDMNRDGVKDTCPDLIYGYKVAVQYTNCTDNDNDPTTPCVCADPTGFDLSNAAWDTTSISTTFYPDNGGTTCLSDDPQPCTATVTIPQNTCNPSTGANCCAVFGVYHVYRRGDSNVTENSNKQIDGFLEGFYTRGTFDPTTGKWTFVRLDTGGILGADVKNFRGELVETGRFQSVVRLQWESVVEEGVLGYHVWRSCSADGRFTRVTNNLIPTTGTPGTTYSYDDSAYVCVREGAAFYKLEIVKSGPQTNFHDIVVKVPISLMPPERGPGVSPPSATSKKKPGAVTGGRRVSTTRGFIESVSGQITTTGRRRLVARITWTSKDEAGVLGYHVWRACGTTGRWVRLTGVPIRAAGKGGSLYSFVDRHLNCPAGKNALYRIEIVRRQGGNTFHPVVVTLPIKRP